MSTRKFIFRPSLTRASAVPRIAFGVVAAGAVAWAGILSVPNTVPKAPFSEEASPRAVESALGSLGITPKVLAAADLSAAQVGQLARASAAYLHTNIATFRAARENAYQAGREVDRLRRLIQAGQGTAQDVAALAAAQSSLNSARSQEQTILNAALAEGGEELTPQLFAKVNLFRANKLLWDLPERYLGDNRTDEQWVALRDAIANETIAARLNQEPDPAAHQLVLAAQSTPNSSAAAANLVHLAEISAAWNVAMQP